MPRHVDHENRRALIEDAVIAIAVESGFAAVTIRAVARHIGASTSAVTHYMGGREVLLRSTVRRETDRRRRDAEEAVRDLGAQEALRTFVEEALLRPDEHTHRFWLAMVLGAASDPVLRAELDRFNDWWDQQLRGHVERVRPTDPDLAADLIDVFVDGLIVTGFDSGRPWPPERRAQLLDALWRALGL
ncbi:TetR/AcrR family transcriptional regulator [Myceligenerans pegani]|uniref:TetR/AcrR family transcriptional regulator n=1 Tax=Myceligenerans pegani TaxID=2776917 RepID=A0ABR9N1U3_9MICO|nr:TetR family transcriptional regulator C-terminal domain-containing protein [Myceligenerans sp. TRM 65318]MBE1877608.1 TetR/AcrR family transcriptional regulator [Myceligenerans sp. TRM 65318]MBE3019879.1 TetR/AcrR family transcriptional regulator [Myceligenerans sp. TRM 65318]